LWSAKGNLVSYIFPLSPEGFVAVSADTDVEPIVAYSLHSGFYADKENLLPKMLEEDIGFRLSYLSELDKNVIKNNNRKWNILLNDDTVNESKNFQQWPAQGSTATGGWITTTWDQSYPYNMFCPIDPSSGQRSVVGCVATAMSMMMNYHSYVGDASFSSPQDSYTTFNCINIDADSLVYDFPGFNRLNEYLDTLKVHYANGIPLTDEDEAALCFACGISS